MKTPIPTFRVILYTLLTAVTAIASTAYFVTDNWVFGILWALVSVIWLVNIIILAKEIFWSGYKAALDDWIDDFYDEPLYNNEPLEPDRPATGTENNPTDYMRST